MSSQGINEQSQTSSLRGVQVAGKPSGTYWDLAYSNGLIDSVEHLQSDSARHINNQFLIPSLCHPHIHLDKAFLLSHPKYADLCIEKGDFAEAMSLTSKFASLRIDANSLTVYYRRSKVSIRSQ
jgi:hypothetical protein